jgi:SOS-response transcriptional repressor LexA
MLIKNAPESIPKSIPNSIPKAKKYPEMTVLAESDLGRYEGKSRTIPVLDARAAAGWPATIDGTGFLDQRPTISLPFGWFQSGEYVLLQIEGDSMHPTIYNGDWAFVRKIEAYNDIKDGYVHIILTRDGIVCKRVLNRPNKGHLALQSDNSAYPTYTVPYEEIISLWKVEMKMSSILRNENLDIIKRLNTMEADIAEMKVKKKG